MTILRYVHNAVALLTLHRCIEFTTDIKSLYPEKEVTLLHSRHRLLLRFDYDLRCKVTQPPPIPPNLHSTHHVYPKVKLRHQRCPKPTVLKTLEELNVELILGERLDLESAKLENMKMNTRG